MGMRRDEASGVGGAPNVPPTSDGFDRSSLPLFLRCTQPEGQRSHEHVGTSGPLRTDTVLALFAKRVIPTLAGIRQSQTGRVARVFLGDHAETTFRAIGIILAALTVGGAAGAWDGCAERVAVTVHNVVASMKHGTVLLKVAVRFFRSRCALAELGAVRLYADHPGIAITVIDAASRRNDGAGINGICQSHFAGRAFIWQHSTVQNSISERDCPVNTGHINWTDLRIDSVDGVNTGRALG